MCDRRYDDNPAGMVCRRTDTHDPDAKGGHVFEASAGPDLDNASSATPKHHAAGDEQ